LGSKEEGGGSKEEGKLKKFKEFKTCALTP
jgi:hypothetical protein